MFGSSKNQLTSTPKALRIGVFYDGGFFHHISNYYRYSHPRRQRISVPGLHEFIRVKAAEFEGVDPAYSHVVDAHFFRGRFSAQQTQAREKLYTERLFDDVLMNENVVTHYRPIQGNNETGIDVALSLECYELAVRGIFDIVVLVAGDSDFVPLVTKLNRLGVRVMLLGWNFEYTDEQKVLHQTTTSMRLINEVTYPVAMHEIMAPTGQIKDPVVRQLFVDSGVSAGHYGSREDEAAEESQPEIYTPAPNDILHGQVCTLKDGFGFICCPEYPNNVFFHFSAVQGVSFDELMEGDEVSFRVEVRDRGPIAIKVSKDGTGADITAE